jgi:hypothetical protein
MHAYVNLTLIFRSGNIISTFKAKLRTALMVNSTKHEYIVAVVLKNIRNNLPIKIDKWEDKLKRRLTILKWFYIIILKSTKFSLLEIGKTIESQGDRFVTRFTD